MRGKIEGSGEMTVSAKMRINRATAQRYEATRKSSHTHQNGDREHAEPLHAELIEATSQAIGAVSDPRLGRTLAQP